MRNGTVGGYRQCLTLGARTRIIPITCASAIEPEPRPEPEPEPEPDLRLVEGSLVGIGPEG